MQQYHPVTKAEREDNYHYAVELADWKSKVRKQRQELHVFQNILNILARVYYYCVIQFFLCNVFREEKTEALLECKEELEHNKALLVKLKQEVILNELF